MLVVNLTEFSILVFDLTVFVIRLTLVLYLWFEWLSLFVCDLMDVGWFDMILVFLCFAFILVICFDVAYLCLVCVLDWCISFIVVCEYCDFDWFIVILLLDWLDYCRLRLLFAVCLKLLICLLFAFSAITWMIFNFDWILSCCLVFRFGCTGCALVVSVCFNWFLWWFG